MFLPNISVASQHFYALLSIPYLKNQGGPEITHDPWTK